MSKSLELFESGFNCAESVLKALADTNNINIDGYLRMASSFGGGIGHTGHICGAISGAAMFLGMMNGRNDNKQKVDELHKLNERMIFEFKEKFGATNCNDLTDCDPLTEEGNIKFKDPARREKCKEFVDYIYILTQEIINSQD